MLVTRQEVQGPLHGAVVTVGRGNDDLRLMKFTSTSF